MGGTPYQSLGCNNCRKRKIGCDLGKPECAKCMKKGIPCPGYDTTRNILCHTIVTRRSHHGEVRRPVSRQIRIKERTVLPTNLETNAVIRTQLFSTYMDNFFAHKTHLSGRDDNWYLLMAQFPSLSGNSELLDRSVVALASVFLAKRTNDCQLARHGVEIYNSAMNKMARMLQQNCSPTPELLYTVIVFHTYETMQNGNAAMRNCLAHIQGATAMLKHYNYNIHCDRSLFNAMLTRQKWATTYFLINTPYRSEVDYSCLTLRAKESSLDELFAIVPDCASLQMELEKIAEQQSRNPEITYKAPLQRLLRRCVFVGKVLQNWLNGSAKNLKDGPSPCRRGALEHDTGLLPLDPRLDPFKFESMETAKIYLLFWVVSLVTRRVIYQAENILLREPDPADMLFYASEICRSVAYCMQPSTRMSTGQVTLFAISQASKSFIDCGNKENFIWCQEVYPIISSCGFDMTVQMSETEWELWNAAHATEASLPILSKVEVIE